MQQRHYNQTYLYVNRNLIKKINIEFYLRVYCCRIHYLSRNIKVGRKTIINQKHQSVLIFMINNLQLIQPTGHHNRPTIIFFLLCWEETTVFMHTKIHVNMVNIFRLHLSYKYMRISWSTTYLNNLTKINLISGIILPKHLQHLK